MRKSDTAQFYSKGFGMSITDADTPNSHHIPDEELITEGKAFIREANQENAIEERLMGIPQPNEEPFENKNAEALEKALDGLGVSIRWNSRALRNEFRTLTPPAFTRGEWLAFNDRSEADLQEQIAKVYTYKTYRGESPLHFGRERWLTCINSLLHVREVDPFEEWLEQHARARDWDGLPRIESLLITLFGCNDTPFVRWAGKYIFLGALLRTRQPGSKLDEFPILIGPQGIGKSSFCRNLFPPEKFAADWFTDGVRLAASDKEKVEALRGAVLVEFSELAGIRKAELEHLKTFISRQDDGVARMAYARNRESMPRQCIFIGTTNVHECLPNDPTGNRRFIPIECSIGSNIEKYMQENRNQLWAEAQNYTEERPNLPRELFDEQQGLAEKYRARDELAEDFIAGLEKRPYRLKEIQERSDAPRELIMGNGSRRLTAALQVKGWRCTQMTIGGKRGRYWTYPSD